MKKNQIVLLISAIIILGGVALAYYLIATKPKPTPPKKLEAVRYAKMDEVEYGEYEVTINATGTVRALNKIDIYSEVQGIYDPIGKPFREGVSFSKGETMLAIDKREAELTLKTQKSELLNAIASLMADFKSDFPQSFERWNSYLSDFDLDKNIRDLPKPASDKEKYFLTVRNIYKLYFGIKNQEIRLSKFEIVAPFDGTVTMSMVEPGILVRPNTKLGEFSGKGVYEVSFAIRASDLKYVKLGSAVQIEHSGKDYDGKVVRISDRIDPTTQSVNVFVITRNNDFKDGMYVNGKVEGNKLRDVYRLPREALVDNSKVYTLEEDQLAQEQVDLIYLGKEYAYLRGLDEDETVVAEALANIKLGTKLKRKEK